MLVTLEVSIFGAFIKAESAAGTTLPTSGMVFLSLNDKDKPSGLVVAKRLRELGLGIAATSGTADYLSRFGYPVDRVVGAGLLVAAKEFGCDLLSMGAYSHSRLRQLILGGVTRHVLEYGELPVMMSR